MSSPTTQLRFEDLHLSTSGPTTPSSSTTSSPSSTRSGTQQWPHKQGKSQQEEIGFQYFSHLPTELRLKIYILALPISRLVPIHYLSRTESDLQPSASSSALATRATQYSSPTCYATSYPPYSNLGPTTTPPKNSIPINRHLIGCTSPSPIPALLHVCQESRALASRHYTLSFALCGPSTMFPPKIWFASPQPCRILDATSVSAACSDILFFPSKPGYLASFKHYLNILSLMSANALVRVGRLAVSEDLFLEGWRERREWTSWGDETSALAGSSGESMGVVEDRLRDFWRDVRKKFGGVREVYIVCGRCDNLEFASDLFARSVQDRMQPSSLVDFQASSGIGVDACPASNLTLNSKANESFEAMISRIVAEVEMEGSGNWEAPKWCMLHPGNKDGWE